jgi:hypothetical protein
MKMFVRRLAGVIGATLASLAASAVWAPAIGSAQPLDCDNGRWWVPVANVCRPPLIPPPPA